MMIRAVLILIAALLAPAGLAPAQTTQPENDFGVLVMAHGGRAEWNREVAATLAPLRRDYRLEIAFGMADPATIQEAATRLDAQGARRIAVVRLFISGESWRERTEQILGMRPGAPPHGAGHGGHGMEFWRIDSDARFALSGEGLAQAPEMGEVMVERVRALSREPRRESVLILAHGPEDDSENARWIRQIDARAEAVRQLAPFRAVQVETLREDWPEKRAVSEARIRGFIEQARRDGGEAIVIPYRVQGFGPYAQVLRDLNYRSDGKGLVPSTQAEHWVRRQAEALRASLFERH
jgi:sirohydrochlorin ferrochelatase